jgi:hypothetical protein
MAANGHSLCLLISGFEDSCCKLGMGAPPCTTTVLGDLGRILDMRLSKLLRFDAFAFGAASLLNAPDLCRATGLLSGETGVSCCTSDWRQSIRKPKCFQYGCDKETTMPT